MQETENKKKISLLFTVYLVLLCLAALIIGRALLLVNDIDYSGIRELNTGWRTTEGIAISLDEISYSLVAVQSLPDVNDNEMLFFRAKNIMVSVYIDGNLVNDAGAVEMENDFGYKAPGTYFVSVPLVTEYSGKEVRLIINSPYQNDSSCSIKNVCIGESRLVMQREINNKLFPACLCIALICIGIIYLVVAVPLCKLLKSGIRLMYLGWFSLILGVWSLTETKLLQLLFGHSNFIHLVTGITLMLIVLPLFLFFKSNYKTATSGATSLVTWITFLLFGISLALHNFGIADLHQLISLAHVILLVGIIFTIYYAILDGIRTKFRGANIIGLFSLAVCALIDLLGYKLQWFQDNSTMIRFGVLVYMGTLGYNVICEYIKVHNLNLKSKLLHKMAYYDVLTEAHNRTAFNTDMVKFANAEDGGANRLIAVFDINNLKYVNDKFGHSAGDKLIVDSYDFIETFFKKFGRLYRIGGDEFVLIAEPSIVTNETIGLVCTKFEKALHSYNTANAGQFPIHIAYGYCAVTDEFSTLQDAFNEADRLMYICKKRLKERYPEYNIRR